jgi:oligopeptide transport system ATP-binding protein
MTHPLLKVEHLIKKFPIRSGLLRRHTDDVHAVSDIHLELSAGETLALVGESGCGKSTLGRTIMKIYEPTSGRIMFEGQDVSELKGQELMAFRKNVQMVFQDPFSSLNPRRTVFSIIEQPLLVHGTPEAIRRERVRFLLDKIGLGSWAQNRYPHEFSGGQRQRIAIARAIALSPKLVIADEPVSALDVSVRSQILNLMADLKEEMGIAYLFISHDLSVVHHMADQVAVMYLGRIVERGSRQEIFTSPQHPYTRALLAANPLPGRGKMRQRAVLTGDVPSPVTPPSGCGFHPRCLFAREECKKDVPTLRPMHDWKASHVVACHRAGSLGDTQTAN